MIVVLPKHGSIYVLAYLLTYQVTILMIVVLGITAFKTIQKVSASARPHIAPNRDQVRAYT